MIQPKVNLLGNEYTCQIFRDWYELGRSKTPLTIWALIPAPAVWRVMIIVLSLRSSSSSKSNGLPLVFPIVGVKLLLCPCFVISFKFTLYFFSTSLQYSPILWVLKYPLTAQAPECPPRAVRVLKRTLSCQWH